MFSRAVARILFQPRQRGKLGFGGGAPSGVKWQSKGVRGRSLTEAESFSVVGCPKEMENVLQFYYFTTYSATMS